MKKWLAVSAVCGLLAGANGVTIAGDQGQRVADDNPGLGPDDNPGREQGPRPQLTRTVLEFQTMVGVDGPFLRAANPIRGINGGGLPWVLDAAKGELKDDGKLEVEVQGLVIPEEFAPAVCNGVACNPAPFFQAILSCLTLDEFGAVVADNINIGNGPEVMVGDPTAGDAKIEAMLELPDPCVAPIVFVTNQTGTAWFAVTGVGAIQ